MDSVKSEPEFIVVSRSLDEEAERIELPTNAEDNTLGLQTLIGAFPGAHGLKYKNPTSGAFRAVLIDASGTKFHPPSDGWANKVFVVLSQHVEGGPKNAVKKSDQNAKRRKLMVESDDENNSCDSDADPGSGERSGGGGGKYEASAKRQQGASKQKRMMATKEPIHHQSSDATTTEEEEMPNRIVDLLVMGLPFELSEDELRTHFEAFGKVVHTEIKTQRGQSSNRGFGFVQMGDLDAQKRVLKQKIHAIGNRECQVKIPFTKNALSSKIFVGRIKESMSIIELRKYFTEEAHKIDPECSVTDVYIPRPFRSFAFVTFSSPKVAKELIKIGQMSLGDSPLSISSAHSTRPQQDAHSGHHTIPFIHPPRPPFQSTDYHRPTNFVEDSYGHDWYNNYGNERSEHESSSGTLPRHRTPGIPPNRTIGPMFSAHNYQPNPMGNTFNGNPPVAAGSQMLNQLETLNLNNIGIPQLGAAIKAIMAAAVTNQDGMGGTTRAMPQQQVYAPPYQSLSPPPPGTSAASRSPVYKPQYGGQQSGGGGTGGRRNGNGGWR